MSLLRIVLLTLLVSFAVAAVGTALAPTAQASGGNNKKDP